MLYDQKFGMDPAPDGQDDALQEALCSDLCPFADHCNGIDLVPFCMLQESGGLPPVLGD